MTNKLSKPALTLLINIVNGDLIGSPRHETFQSLITGGFAHYPERFGPIAATDKGRQAARDEEARRSENESEQYAERRAEDYLCGFGD